MQRLADIRAEVRNKIQKGANSTYDARLDQWINSRYRDLYDRYLWRDLIVFNEAITIAAEEFLVLPKECGIMMALTQRETSNVVTGVQTPVYQHTYLAEATTTGSPVRWTPAGTVSVADQPSSASALSIVSSDADDITQIVRIAGIESTNSQKVSESVTLTGTTAATSTYTYSTVEAVSKSGTTEGSVTVTSNSAAVTICVLAPGEIIGYYSRIRLHPIPGAALTGYLCYKKQFHPMVDDNDAPMFDCDRFLVHGAYADALKEMEKWEIAMAEEQFLEKRLKEMISTHVNQIGELPNQAVPHRETGWQRDRIY